MVRVLAIAFGAVTALALLASLTPVGQVMLGLRPAAQATSVTVIEDKPAEIPGASPASPTQPPGARSPQGGPGVVGNVANILLNLPQILDQTRVGPAPLETKPDVHQESKGAGE
ncbi:MAG TPA: hypothetical protein VEW91_11810 [bacterium]|nr:hypothetical protein [bacterium]